VLRDDWRLAAAMPAGSIAGTVAGGLLVGVVPDVVLLPVLAGLLLRRRGPAAPLMRRAGSSGEETAESHPGTEEIEDQAPLGRSRRPRGR
jgi:hypothetical protein